jgi:hypothetical protein
VTRQPPASTKGHFYWLKVAGGCLARQQKPVLAARTNRFWPSGVTSSMHTTTHTATHTQKQRSSAAARWSCAKLRTPGLPRRALLEQQPGPTTQPCTASSITLCSSSQHPHLYHAARCMRRQLPQHRRHARHAPHLALAHATMTCKPTHARCRRVVTSSPAPLLCAHAVWALHVALPHRPPHANHAS